MKRIISGLLLSSPLILSAMEGREGKGPVLKRPDIAAQQEEIRQASLLALHREQLAARQQQAVESGCDGTSLVERAHAPKPMQRGIGRKKPKAQATKKIIIYQTQPQPTPAALAPTISAEEFARYLQTQQFHQASAQSAPAAAPDVNESISDTDEFTPKQTFDLKNFVGAVPEKIKAITTLLISNKKTRNLLLLGKPGTGKTTLAQYIAATTKRDFYHLSGGELVAKYRGHSRLLIKKLFEKARSGSKPAIIFIDEIANTVKKGTDHDTREDGDILTTLFKYIDECNTDTTGFVYVIGAAYQERSTLDEAFRSRFDILEVECPTETERAALIRHYINQVDSREKYVRSAAELRSLTHFIVKNSHGFTRRDLTAIIAIAEQKAALEPINDLYIECFVHIEKKHIEAALLEFNIEKAKDCPSFFKRICTLENAHKITPIALTVLQMYMAHNHHASDAAHRDAAYAQSRLDRLADIDFRNMSHDKQLAYQKAEQEWRDKARAEDLAHRAAQDAFNKMIHAEQSERYAADVKWREMVRAEDLAHRAAQDAFQAKQEIVLNAQLGGAKFQTTCENGIQSASGFLGKCLGKAVDATGLTTNAAAKCEAFCRSATDIGYQGTKALVATALPIAVQAATGSTGNIIQSTIGSVFGYIKAKFSK